MNTARTSVIFLTIAGVLGFAVGIASVLFFRADAGDLEPSAPPGPTMKTLDEVEARIPISGSATPTGTFTISQSGSYYLTGDRYASGTAISVEADNVTIDLNGYSLIGPGSGATYGVFFSERSNVEIRNGTVRNFGREGIREAGVSGHTHHIVNVCAVSNGHDGMYDGIHLTGKNSLVEDCTSKGNTGLGILVSHGGTVTGNTCYENGGDGINVGEGVTATGNTCYENGFRGIYAAGGSTVTGNTCFINGDDGISTMTGSTVTGNTCFSNGSDGIQAIGGCTVIGNTCHSNDSDGINAGSGSTVVANTARVNQNWGIWLVGDNLVDQNTATENNQSSGAYGNMNSTTTSTYGLNHAP